MTGGARCVLLDALGTLLALEDPGPPLAAELARRGAPVEVDRARHAVLAEMTYYRAHHDEASDRERLADLRARCAGVLAAELPEDARALGVPALTDALLAALRFRVFDEVPGALRELRADGVRLVVLSNWDVSLHDQLAATGLDALVDGAVSSAELGVGKPHRAIFEHALEVAGAGAARALMVGDSLDTDVAARTRRGSPRCSSTAGAPPPRRCPRERTCCPRWPGCPLSYAPSREHGPAPGAAGVPRGPAPPAPRDERPWPALLALPIAVGAVVAGLVAFLLADAARSALTDAPVHRPGDAGVAAHGAPPLVTMVSTFTQDAALVLGAVLAAAAALGGRLRPSALGLRPARLWSSAGLVVAGYVGFLALAAGWTSLLGITDRENVAVDLGTRDSPAALAGGILLVCVAAPLAEELFFRGFLFGALRRRGLFVAAAVTGLAFGLAHVASSPIGFLVPLAALGVILCLLYERTGSLYPSIALHCLNNSIAFGVGDGRGWVIPVALAGAGVVLTGVLRAATRALPGAASARARVA